MSEEKKELKDAETKREPYKIEIESLDFKEDFSGKFLTSNELCKLTNEIFRAAFADYVGSQFELVNGMPMISLYFDHAKTKNGTYACERVGAKQSGNNVIDRTRSRDQQLREGDRYHLTEDGIDVIKVLLSPRFYNQGKPNWKNIVSDVADRTATSMYQPQQIQQLTKVVGIDPKAICKLIYGEKEDDSFLDYDVVVKANLSQGLVNSYPNYLLSITKAYTAHIQKTYENLGIGMIGSNIVREIIEN